MKLVIIFKITLFFERLLHSFKILDMKLVIILQFSQFFEHLFHSMPKYQQVTDETGRFMVKEMFSLVCWIRFRQASNADIQEAVQLIHDIEEKFPNGTYHLEFEYRKGVILQVAAKMQQQLQQQPQQQPQQQQQHEVPPKPQHGSGP